MPRLCAHGNDINRVTTCKLVDVFISSDLSWECHVESMLQKVAKWMHCIIIQLELVSCL